MEDINSAIKEEILKDFKILNSLITDTGFNNQENIYKIYLDKAVQSILNLTNRLRFPVALKFIVIDMMTDFYNINQAKTNQTPESSSKNITSMSEAGRSISLGNSSDSYYSTLISKHIDEQLSSRHKEINRYKLLYREGLHSNGKD